MFVVALSLAGHFVRGVYMQPWPTQTARQRSAKSRRQPAACSSLQCHAYASCQSWHLAN